VKAQKTRDLFIKKNKNLSKDPRVKVVTLFGEERVVRKKPIIAEYRKKELSLALAIAAAHSLARVASNNKVRGISTVHTPFPFFSIFCHCETKPIILTAI